MLKNLKIDGVSYSFLFGFYAMLITEEEFGIPLDKYLDGTATDNDWMRNLPQFIWAAIKNGAYANGNEVKISVHKVQAELDKNPKLVKEAMSLIVSALTDWIGAQTESTDTAKKGRQGVQQKPQA